MPEALAFEESSVTGIVAVGTVHAAAVLRESSHTAQVLAAGGRVAYTVLFNTTATHGLPAALNAASNALLHSMRGDAAAGSIAVVNHPMPTLQGEAAIQFSKIAGASVHVAQSLQATQSYPQCMCRRMEGLSSNIIVSLTRSLLCKWFVHWLYFAPQCSASDCTLRWQPPCCIMIT
jgi:hypothetical protein